MLFRFEDAVTSYWVWTPAAIDENVKGGVRDAMMQHLEELRVHRAHARKIFDQHSIRESTALSTRIITPQSMSHLPHLVAQPDILIRHTSARYNLCIIEPSGVYQFKNMHTHVRERLLYHVFHGWHNSVWQR